MFGYVAPGLGSSPQSSRLLQSLSGAVAFGTWNQTTVRQFGVRGRGKDVEALVWLLSVLLLMGEPAFLLDRMLISVPSGQV